MGNKYCALTLLLLALYLSYLLPNIGFEDNVLHSLPYRCDGETKLAFGEPLYLLNTNIYELNLIKGISDRLSEAILKKKDLLLDKAKELNIGVKYKALTEVRGIGERNSKKFAVYIDLESKEPQAARSKTGCWSVSNAE